MSSVIVSDSVKFTYTFNRFRKKNTATKFLPAPGLELDCNELLSGTVLAYDFEDLSSSSGPGKIFLKQ